MKLTFASLLFHSCKEFMLLEEICLWVKHRSRIFGNKWFPVKDTASSAYFVCIIQVKRNPHRNNEKGVLQLTMTICILIAITTPGIYFLPKGKDYQEADHTYSIGAQPPKKLAFCKRAKKRGGWFSVGNQRQGGFLPHRNIATPSAPVRGLYSQALEERGHIPVKPAHSPASPSSQTQHGSFWFCSRGPGSIYKWTSKWKWSSVSGGHNQFGVVQTVFLFCYVMRRLRHFFVFYY